MTKVVEMYQEQQPKEKQADYIFIRKNSNLMKIGTDDILWIEALGNYVVINTHDDKHTIHSTMKNIENKLPANNYVRVHRSYIVPINKISSVNGRSLQIDSKMIPVSSSYKKSLMKRLYFI